MLLRSMKRLCDSGLRFFFPGCALAFVHVHEVEQEAADNEERDHGENCRAHRPGACHDDTEKKRAEYSGETTEHAEEPEEFARLVSRDYAREKRSAERLRAALYRSHEKRENVEMRGRLHVIAEDADDRVDREADKDRRLGSQPAGEHSKRKRERNPDELNEQDCGDEREIGRAHV